MKIKDLLENRKVPLSLLLGIAAVLTLLTAGSLLDGKRSGEEQNVIEKTAAAGLTPDNTDRQMKLDEAEERDYFTAGQRAENTNQETMASVVVEEADEDDICAAICQITENSGRYTGGYDKAKYDALRYAWQITNLSYLQETDERYEGLYKYAAGILCDSDFTLDALDVSYEEGDQVWCAAYVERKEDGSAVIHKVAVDMDILLDDNYVPRNSL